MKKLVRKDKLRRDIVARYELRYRLFKVLQFELAKGGRSNLSLLTPAFFLDALPKDASIVRLRNRCSVTGRGNAVFSFFHLSRIQFREFAHFGLITGLCKASW
uniref:Ribosomal protein S14 n=1 Tax=Goniomonas avonlea TaxID=1255295 RepID=A0A348G6K7_9CRYP|nr:ribosomal protein S14 [Goniomonas avonlea]